MAKTKKKSANSLLDGIIRWHLYALIILIPLIFWFDTQTIFTIPKLISLRIFSISSGFFILLKFCLHRAVKFRLPAHSIFLAFWALSLIVSTVFSINTLSSIFGQYGRFMGLISILNLLLIPLYIANFFRPKDLSRIIDISIITAVVSAIYGLLQYFDFFGLWKLDFSWSDSPQNRVFGTMGHANHLGAYLAAHFLMLLYRLDLSQSKALSWKVWAIRLVKLLSLILIVTVIMLTASRGAALALILAALMLLAVKGWKYRKSISKAVWRTAGGFMALILLIGGALLTFSGTLQDLSIFRRTEQTIQTIDKGYLPDRVSFLLSSWQIFLDHPLTGSGLSTFRDSYSAYRRADYFIDGPGNAQYITVPESSHNQYADVLSTQGLFGLLAYLALISAVLSLLYRQFQSASPAEENFYLALLGGILVFLFQTLFNFGEIINLFLFYLLIGIVLAGSDSREISLKKIPATLVYPTSAVLTIALILAFQYFVIPEVKADYYLKQAHLSEASQEIDLAKYFYEKTVIANDHEYQLFQNFADYQMQAAFLIDGIPKRIAILQQAASNYQRAIQLNSNYPSTYHNLALSYIELFRLTKDQKYADLSRQNYQLAIQKSPNNPRYLYEFARKLHSEWNDVEGAISLLKRALQIVPGYQEPRDYLNFLYKNYPQLAKP